MSTRCYDPFPNYIDDPVSKVVCHVSGEGVAALLPVPAITESASSQDAGIAEKGLPGRVDVLGQRG